VEKVERRDIIRINTTISKFSNGLSFNINAKMIGGNTETMDDMIGSLNKRGEDRATIEKSEIEIAPFPIF
jgi:hypothetical protein